LAKLLALRGLNEAAMYAIAHHGYIKQLRRLEITGMSVKVTSLFKPCLEKDSELCSIPEHRDFAKNLAEALGSKLGLSLEQIERVRKEAEETILH